MALFIHGHNITTSLHTSFSADPAAPSWITPSSDSDFRILGEWLVETYIMINWNIDISYVGFGAQEETHKAPYYGRNALEEPYLLITQGEISPVMTS